MQKYTEPRFSKSKVDWAGDILFGRRASEFNLMRDEAYQVFANFRDAHNWPLHIFIKRLKLRAHQMDSESLVVQRLKRIPSISAKLSRFPTMRLSMMQDIGGCRAILKNVTHVRKFVEKYKQSHMPHELAQEDDYITNPKPSGYRGVHLIYRYKTEEERRLSYNNLKIEIQFRSKLQHAWATAVETFGIFTRQALKSSQGEGDWLRFFSLMGSALALREKCEPIPGTPTGLSEIRKELNPLIQRLNVESYLHTFSQAVTSIPIRRSKASYYLLELNPAERQVKITGYRSGELERAQHDYLVLEQGLKEFHEAVLVSADSLAALERAYPNYYLDTSLFVAAMQEAIGEK
jgi:ppGpp synthetase/RelA/SpoT-type nucleotidyltranferase